YNRCEEFGYVAYYAYEEKTGEEDYPETVFPLIESMPLSGQWVEESKIPKTFPKLDAILKGCNED
ncbi:MAG: hypothetical protein AAF846_22670, partial [Chloroflexota bacterium]